MKVTALNILVVAFFYLKLVIAAVVLVSVGSAVIGSILVVLYWFVMWNISPVEISYWAMIAIRIILVLAVFITLKKMLEYSTQPKWDNSKGFVQLLQL